MSKSLYQSISQNLFIIAGPCVIESQDLLFEVAEELVRLKEKFQIPIIFKASFDKANRTSIDSFRGPGLKDGLKLLYEVKDRYKLPLTTDIHESTQAVPVGEIVDIIQIPAFLSRQTDLLVAAGKTGKIVNIKKAQFLSGKDMQYPAEKVASTNNTKIVLTERGNMYGYNNMAVDFRNIPDMQTFGYPVVMDCTHAVQRPGGNDGKTGGNREFVPAMAYAARAFGANGYFLEVHPNPERAKSDGPNMLYLRDFEGVLEKLLAN